MVFVKKADETKFRECLDIIEANGFAVYVDGCMDYNIYKRRYKNTVIQFVFGHIFRRRSGYIGWNSTTNEFDIYGNAELFMDVAQKIEKVGVRVTIKF